MVTYTIFGAGPSGLYTAYRLLTGQMKNGQTFNAENDKVVLYEWGDYQFPGIEGTRQPSGRICTHYYNNDRNQSYVEVGGMRYVDYNCDTKEGHRLVSHMVDIMGCQTEDFYTTENPLYFLRAHHFYSSDFNKKGFTAPYFAEEINSKPPEDIISEVSESIYGNENIATRGSQCQFYKTGTLPVNLQSTVYQPGQNAGNIGYWNIFYDQAGNEGFRYAADGNGYSSNVINWNAANAAVYNGEFAPGGSYKTLKNGYSELFSRIFEECQNSGDDFKYYPKKRLHSIWSDADGTAKFQIAEAQNPDKPAGDALSSDYVFLCLPPNAIKAVADATRYADMGDRDDFLNHENVTNYLESVIEQPSYKIAMFFDRQWWNEISTQGPDAGYPPDLTNECAPGQTEHVYGPTITDLPLRQIYYFGNNSPSPLPDQQAVYGILASYDDMRFTKFWQELEVPIDERRSKALSRSLQPMEEVSTAPELLEKMVLLELSKVHYGKADGPIPPPLETVFMNWGLNPFGAGYHAWSAHYDITDVMQKIRFPTVMAGGNEDNANVFIAGSAFSNDQAWVEGAFATVESILSDKLNMREIDGGHTDENRLICNCGLKKTQVSSAL